MDFVKTKIDYEVYNNKKIVDIHDLDFQTKKELEILLADLIKAYHGFSISYPSFHNKEDNYGLIVGVLRKLKFKLLYKKPIFKKRIKSADSWGIIKFKKVISNKDKAICLKMYKLALKNTLFPADYLDSLNPRYYFDRYILNKNSKLNFFIIYKNKAIGFVTIHINAKRKYGYIGFITVLKKYNGRGFSYEILKKVENELKHRHVKKWLESTDQNNKPMINSFKKYGFKKIRYLCGYIYRPEIAYKKFI